jgi:hypothetical protein
MKISYPMDRQQIPMGHINRGRIPFNEDEVEEDVIIKPVTISVEEDSIKTTMEEDDRIIKEWIMEEITVVINKEEEGVNIWTQTKFVLFMAGISRNIVLTIIMELTTNLEQQVKTIVEVEVIKVELINVKEDIMDPQIR